jgi:hypothetical protein
VSYQSRLNERGDEVGVTAFAAFRACDMRSRRNSCERPNCSSNLTRISTFNLIFVSKLVKRCYLSSYTITHRKIGDKNFFRKNHEPLPSIEFRLNGHSSLIKHNMAMNSTPLDSSFQCVSFHSKKFYLLFFV